MQFQFLAIILFLSILKSTICEYKIELMKMENCSSSSRTFYIDTCECIKDGLNFSAIILRPLNKIYVQLNMSRFENARYKSVFKVPPTEWCSVMSKRAKPNMLVKAFLDTIRERMPKSVQNCPIDGRIEAFNLLLKSKMLQIFPSGIYRVSAHGYDDLDDNILSMSFLMRTEN